MEPDHEEESNLETLTLSNAVSLSALVAILIRKGMIGEIELVEEIRRLKGRFAKGGD